MKGMTNALPVLIDASTLATKSDISDMETKTHANATFATKTALTTLQNATKVAVENFAITESSDKVTITTTAIDGATSKSEDIPAVTDTMAGIVTPELKKKWDSNGGGSASSDWIKTTFGDLDKTKLKVGSQIMGTMSGLDEQTSTLQGLFCALMTYNPDGLINNSYFNLSNGFIISQGILIEADLVLNDFKPVYATISATGLTVTATKYSKASYGETINILVSSSEVIYVKF